VGLKASRASGPDAAPDWGAIAEGITLEFRQAPDGQHTVMDGEDVEAAIRTPEISDWSSRVSADPRVRRALTQRMRAMARAENVVMEGRDIGTVVLPDARLKIFLTAPEEERARRRALELAQKGDAVSNADVRREMAERDRRDATRTEAPLVKARDAVEVNTAGLSAEEVIDRIATMARERM
jgi:cytidylate kinase